MPIVDLKTSFDDAKEESDKLMQPLPAGPYEVLCNACTLEQYKSGRPCVKFEFSVVGNANPVLNGKKIFHSCPLPHNGTNSGLGFLVDVTKALGSPWAGSSINTDDYPGRTATANIIQEPDKVNPAKLYNNIKSFA